MTDDTTSSSDATPESAAEQLAAEIRRRRRAASLSQRELAQRSGYTREYISMAERPGNIPSHDLVRALDRTLDADGALVELRARAKAEQGALRQRLNTEPSTESLPDVPRRAFAPATLTNDLFMRREIPESATVAPGLASQLQAVAVVYRNAYSSLPAHQLFAATREHLNLVLSLRPDNQPPRVRKKLLSTAGEMAALAMPVLGLDLGRWKEAAQYLEIAFRAAREADNTDLEAVVWACRAFHAAYGMGDLTAGCEYADEAVATSRDGATATTRAWTAAVASERYADLGQAKASLERLDKARAALARNENQTWSGMGTFDHAKIEAYEGGNYSRLKHHNDALRVLDVALSKLDESLLRHRGTAFIDRAEVRAAMGDLDAACADARSALSLAMETQHAGTVWRVKRIAKATLGSGGATARRLWHDVLAAQAANAVKG